MNDKISNLWDSFYNLLDRKRSGENIEEALKNLFSLVDKIGCEITTNKEYDRLANLFYRCNEILLMEYGVESPVRLPLHPTERAVILKAKAEAEAKEFFFRALELPQKSKTFYLYIKAKVEAELDKIRPERAEECEPRMAKRYEKEKFAAHERRRVWRGGV